MRSLNVEYLMGHNFGISRHYYRPQPHEVFPDYLKAVDDLTVGDKKTSSSE